MVWKFTRDALILTTFVVFGVWIKFDGQTRFFWWK